MLKKLFTPLSIAIAAATYFLVKKGGIGSIGNIWEKDNDEDIDIHAARELYLFIENDYDLYRQRRRPIEITLSKKKKKGTYDAERAVKAFKYLVDDGAKKYQREYGGANIFDAKTKKAVAKSFAHYFEIEYDAQGGNMYS